MNVSNARPPRYLFRQYEILKNIQRGNRFLEIGGGRLQLTLELAKLFNKGDVVDFSDDISTYYSNLASELSNVEAHVLDFMKEGMGNKYDLIVACEVMEHIVEDSVFVQRIKQHLNDDGKVVLSVPAKQKFWTIHDELSGHVKRYEKQELYKLFADFASVRVINYGYPFVNILRHLRALDARIRLKKERAEKTIADKTKQSSSTHLGAVYSVIANEYTFHPLFKIASLFNEYDLSEGYLVFATNKRV
ncbi:MAG: methyltransferase domain-containing protein [Pseudomonadota bacterium]